MPERVTVIGVGCDGAPLSPAAAAALAGARLVVGARRHLGTLAPAGTPVVPLGSGDGVDLAQALDLMAGESGPVCVLASGDPGFFGVLRAVTARFGDARVEVHAALSSVAAAFARVGMPWDDAVVVSAHGRPLEDAVAVAAGTGKAAVLVSPDHPPEALGKALLAAGSRPRHVHVCSRLGTASESVVTTDLAGLAGAAWDPLSVVVLVADEAGEAGAKAPVLAWGLPDDRFEHRDGMVTKAEVRAIALGKLDLPPRGVLWDVGAGSGSVAIEASRLAPALDVHAVERDEGEAARLLRNAAAHQVTLNAVVGEAPSALTGLPDPDRAFVGGGGIPVLDAVLARLRPGGKVVATYAAVDRAAQAEARLGHLVEVAVARGERLPDGGLRLVARNPVFVVWGPG